MSTTREEENALKHNKGIIDLFPIHMMSLDEISFSFMAGLYKLRESITTDHVNYGFLARITHGLRSVGVIPPINISEAPELTKEDLLTLCGQIQRYSTSVNYNNKKREMFREIARDLRGYIYTNYQITIRSPKVGRKPQNPQPPEDKVENAPKP